MDILMVFIRRASLIRSMLLVAFLLATMCAQGKKAKKSEVLSSRVDNNTVVRFFFQPPVGNFFHVPLIFRVADIGNSKANTAPINNEGRIAYISSSEMQHILQQMSVTDIVWQEAKTVDPVGSSFDLPVMDKMAITVFSSGGTARANVSPNKVCQVLAPLNSIITTPRAKWELKSFQTMYFCKVTEFDPNAYPDHY